MNLKKVLLALVLACTCELFAPRSAKAVQNVHVEGPCFAYLLNGDVWFRCRGQSRRVTAKGDVTDFAVDQTVFALFRNRDPLEVVSLSGNQEVRYLSGRRPGSLYASCGKVLCLSYGYDKDGLANMWLVKSVSELPGGESLKLGPYLYFRCSADRRTVVGTADKGRTLMEGLPPSRTLAGFSKNFSYLRYMYFDVSPNGEFVGYYHAPQGICVQQPGQRATCVDDEGFDRVSVSDAGTILYTTHWDGTCSYKDAYHVSRRPLPGYSHSDQCVAVAMWKPGMKKPRIVVPLAGYPQWIAPSAASSLLKLSERLAGTKR
jgi:hypothetical protein